MRTSITDIQRNAILSSLRDVVAGEWKVLVVDEGSRKIIDNVMKEDDILSQNITNIEQIEHKRPRNKDMDAVYFLSPLPHIVDCVLADLERRRYRRAALLWTSLLHPELRSRIDKSNSARDQIAQFRVLNLDFFPRESHLITFRDPWSFPILYHPACSNLVRQHMEDLAQKIVSVCVCLGEYPTIRYYRPPHANHEARVLCFHLARFVQEAIDLYAKFHGNFPPQTARPRGVLFIVDRSMDVIAPLVHEFTYQAMAHDLLPLKEGEKVTYTTVSNEGRPDQEAKELVIEEKDGIWVENRHRHMKDTIEKLIADFQRFVDENPHFANSDSSNANSLSAIKDMLAGLPQFQGKKEAYSLHLNMAQECMNVFQQRRLPDVASVEQSLATGLDEDFRKPKNLVDTLVRTLDEENVVPPDRLRLIALYLIYRDGLLPGDIQKLLAHAQLPPQDAEVLNNLELLGVRVTKPLKDARPSARPMFARKQPPMSHSEEYSLSRFEPALKQMLEEYVKGTLDYSIFPSTKPELDATHASLDKEATQASLRSVKPQWAKARDQSNEPKQRVIVFMAGGATYSESRACYEITRTSMKEVFLATSHMLTPGLFLRQLGDLSVDKRRLNIPAEMPKPGPPKWMLEKEDEPPPPSKQQQPQKASSNLQGPRAPTAGMEKLSLGVGGSRPPNGAIPPTTNPAAQQGAAGGTGQKEPEKEKKKKHLFFSSKRG